MDRQRRALDQPPQPRIGRRVERRREQALQPAPGGVGDLVMAALPARQGRLGDTERLRRVALLHAAHAPPATQRTAELVHAATATCALALPWIKAATRSAIIMVGALVLPPTRVGITE